MEISTKFRKIKFTISNPEHRNKKGVYCIWFGDRFYIGKANNLGSRISAHRWHINKMVCDIVYDRSGNWSASYLRIMEHLKQNPNIIDAEAYIIEVCDTDEDALKIERDWLKTMQGHFLNWHCLNKQFYWGLEQEDLDSLNQHCF